MGDDVADKIPSDSKVHSNSVFQYSEPHSASHSF